MTDKQCRADFDKAFLFRSDVGPEDLEIAFKGFEAAWSARAAPDESLVKALEAKWKPAGIGVGAPLVRLDEVIAIIRAHAPSRSMDAPPEMDIGESAGKPWKDLSAQDIERYKELTAITRRDWIGVLSQLERTMQDAAIGNDAERVEQEIVPPTDARPTSCATDNAVSEWNPDAVLARLKPEGERTKIEELEACYAMLFNHFAQMAEENTRLKATPSAGSTSPTHNAGAADADAIYHLPREAIYGGERCPKCNRQATGIGHSYMEGTFIVACAGISGERVRPPSPLRLRRIRSMIASSA